ncbi:MAG: recombinase family protein [Finegoldia magna]|nr:recombinase family protein [Finegoldia magna]
MKKCFVYYRFSSEQQRDGASIVRQKEVLREYIKRHNVCDGMDDPEVVEILDESLSAFKGLNMSEGQLGKWMDQVRIGMWDGSRLVVESTDRFSRLNPFTVLSYIGELVSHKITMIDASNNMWINLANSQLLPIVTMSAQRAYEESVIKSKRIADGWRRRRDTAFSDKGVVTNKTPQWINVVDNKYVLNDKAEVVREIFRLCKSGIGTPTIAKILREKGDEWQFDRPWRAESVHKILRNRRVTGVIFISEIIRDFESTDNIVEQKNYEKEVYPVVISNEEFELVGKLLASRKPGSGKSVGRVSGGSVLKNIEGVDVVIEQSPMTKSNIFNSVCRCGRCGEPMYHNVVERERFAKRKGEMVKSEYRYIRCIGERDNLCTNKAFRYDAVEHFVIEHIKNLDFSKVIQASEVNPELELLRLNIQEEIEHITEYERGIERLKAANKKVPFDIVMELNDSQEKLHQLKIKLASYDKVQVDVSVLKNIDTSVVYDVHNIEVRSLIEQEINNLIERIDLYREDNFNIVTLRYKDNEVLKHVLITENGKKPKLISRIAVVKNGDVTTYETASFKLIATDEQLTVEVPQEIVLNDYVLLLNYIDGLKDEHSTNVAVWMREHMNEVLTNTLM